MATTKQTAATANATVDNDQRDASGYSINDYKAIYESASRENNAELMQWANNGANAIRTSQGGTAEYADQAIANAQSAGRTPATNTNPSTLNESLHDGTDSDKSKFNAALQEQINWGNANPTATQGFTQEEFNALYGNVQSSTAPGYTIGQMYDIGANGEYTYDEARKNYAESLGYKATLTTYNGKPAWLIERTDAVTRPQQSGTSGADEAAMNDQYYAALLYEKQRYADAQAAYNEAVKTGNQDAMASAMQTMNEAHLNAERLRAGSSPIIGNYSGGKDGSTYFTYGELANPDIYDFFGKNPYTGDNVYANAIGQTPTHTHTQTGSTGTEMGGYTPSTTPGYFTPGTGTGTGTGVGTGTGTGTGTVIGGTTIPSVDDAKSNLLNMLEQWKTAAVAQSNGQIDFAVQQAITELERALADAQPQYKEQQESIARDEMQSLDNSALYAEARGDKGGIGQEQYNSIMNTAAQNRLAVQQAQTKLSTDTQRQIADLRAQGEFEKADKLLEITQNYLAQLINLEQWALDYGLSVAQFQESIRQWELNYELAVAEFNESIRQWDESFAYQQYRDSVSDSQWQQSFDASNSQWQQQFNYTQSQNTNSQLASTGAALLEAGIMPSFSQLSAMGMTSMQAQSYIAAAKLAAQSGSGSVTGGGGTTPITPSYVSSYQQAYNAGCRSYEDAYAFYLSKDGGSYSKDEAAELATYFAEKWEGNKKQFLTDVPDYNTILEDSEAGLYGPEFGAVLRIVQSMWSSSKDNESIAEYLEKQLDEGKINEYGVAAIMQTLRM